jgi:hypothetical protein
MGDLLKGRAPVGFVKMGDVAARQLNVFRAGYEVCDVLAPLGRDNRVVGVM